MSGSSPLYFAELGRRLRIAHGDERLERRLQPEEIVLVRLVRADRDLDPRVEVHPVLVALAVVVVANAAAREVRNFARDLFCVGAGGLEELGRRGLEPLGVGLRIGDGLEVVARRERRPS